MSTHDVCAATADNIDASSLRAMNKSGEPGSVMLHWNEPPAPNGLIITYEVEIEYAGGQGVGICCRANSLMPIKYVLSYEDLTSSVT
jgi:hypothetical protein